MNSVKLCYLLLLTYTWAYPEYPANEYEYSLKRDLLKEAERNFQGKNGVLTQDEEIVNHYLQYLKWQEFEATKYTDFPPARPIEVMMDHIMDSAVYKALLPLPKGGNMHTHENHQLSKSTILDIVWNSTDFQYLYMLPEDHSTSPWVLDFFVDPPNTGVGEPDWVQIEGSSYTKEEILEKQTFLGILSDVAKSRPTDARMRWNEMNVLWDRMSNLFLNIKIKERYIEELINSSLAEGVQYIESRKHLGPDETIYEIDPEYAQNNGKREIGDAEMELNITKDIVDRILLERPEFIGLSRVMYTNRRKTFEEYHVDMERAVFLHTKYPEQVVAFDMVGEEDAGNSHIFYLRNLLELYSEESQRSEIALKFHTSETNWPDDLITSENINDPVGTAQNTYESILLGASRIGHGLGFAKHPYLLQQLKDRDIAIETCPVSNQLLGFTPDLRNHPAVTYLRYGIPIILGTDDPGTFGYDHFTIDWYEAFMAWGLDLEDLRMIAMNSLRYSSMSPEQITNAIELKWKPAWDSYIQSLRDEACDATYEGEPHFGSVLPRDGANVGGTFVHVFGRNLQSGICKEISCKFGEAQGLGYYFTQNHIVCISPELSEGEGPAVEVSVSLDGSETFIPTSLNFTYMYDVYTTTIVVGGGPSSFNSVVCQYKSLYAFLLLIYWAFSYFN